jgi:hypothetical protein
MTKRRKPQHRNPSQKRTSPNLTRKYPVTSEELSLSFSTIERLFDTPEWIESQAPETVRAISVMVYLVEALSRQNSDYLALFEGYVSSVIRTSSLYVQPLPENTPSEAQNSPIDTSSPDREAPHITPVEGESQV